MTWPDIPEWCFVTQFNSFPCLGGMFVIFFSLDFYDVLLHSCETPIVEAPSLILLFIYFFRCLWLWIIDLHPRHEQMTHTHKASSHHSSWMLLNAGFSFDSCPIWDVMHLFCCCCRFNHISWISWMLSYHLIFHHAANNNKEFLALGRYLARVTPYHLFFPPNKIRGTYSTSIQKLNKESPVETLQSLRQLDNLLGFPWGVPDAKSSDAKTAKPAKVVPKVQVSNGLVSVVRTWRRTGWRCRISLVQHPLSTLLID